MAAAATDNMATPCESGFPVKLLIDKTSKEIMFMEAESEFVDMILAVLRLPFGALVKLLSDEGHTKAIPSMRLLDSLQTIPTSVFTASDTITNVLEIPDTCKTTLTNALANNTSPPERVEPKVLQYISHGFICANCKGGFARCQIYTNCTKCKGTHCQACCNRVCGVNTATSPISFAKSVQPNLTFIVTDDMTVHKSSTITCVEVINKKKRDMTEIDPPVAITDLCGVDTVATRARVLKMIKGIITCSDAVVTRAFQDVAASA